MKRMVTTFVLAAVAAAALAATATAKEMSVALASAPPTLGPGEPWRAQLLVHGEADMLAEATPGISIRGPGGEERRFTARATGNRAPDGQLLYAARVVFPTEGRWSYRLLDGVTDRAYEGGVVEVGVAPSAAPSAPAVPAEAAAVEDPFPRWPLLAAILVVAVAAAGAIALVRRSRLATR